MANHTKNSTGCISFCTVLVMPNCPLALYILELIVSAVDSHAAWRGCFEGEHSTAGPGSAHGVCSLHFFVSRMSSVDSSCCVIAGTL